MLNKNDLAKQFELVVQQEIKNYNNSLNSILQEIRDLKESIEEIKVQSLENYAVVHSEQNKLSIDIENLKLSFSQTIQHFEKAYQDQRIVNERNALEMRDISFGLLGRISKDDMLRNEIKCVSTTIQHIQNSINSKIKSTNQFVEDRFQAAMKYVDATKKEILSKPSEVSILRKEVEEKIYSHSIDVEGLLKEIRIMRKDVMISEKKLEAIFTILDKLQKTEVSS